MNDQIFIAANVSDLVRRLEDTTDQQTRDLGELTATMLVNFGPYAKAKNQRILVGGERPFMMFLSIVNEYAAPLIHSPAMGLVAKERTEQLFKHNFSIEQDACFYPNGELLELAIEMIKDQDEAEYIPENVPVDLFHKMRAKPIDERLIIAAALIAAEHDRKQWQKNLEANK